MINSSSQQIAANLQEAETPSAKPQEAKGGGSWPKMGMRQPQRKSHGNTVRNILGHQSWASEIPNSMGSGSGSLWETEVMVG